MRFSFSCKFEFLRTVFSFYPVSHCNLLLLPPSALAATVDHLEGFTVMGPPENLETALNGYIFIFTFDNQHIKCLVFFQQTLRKCLLRRRDCCSWEKKDSTIWSCIYDQDVLLWNIFDFKYVFYVPVKDDLFKKRKRWNIKK